MSTDIRQHVADIMTEQCLAPQFAQHRYYALRIIDAFITVIAALVRVWRKLRFRVKASRSMMDSDGEVKPSTRNQVIFKL